jgi:hypothetical protein
MLMPRSPEVSVIRDSGESLWRALREGLYVSEVTVQGH